MEERDYTTITISKGLRERLAAQKIHPNQAYEEVIEELLKKGVTNEQVNKKAAIEC